MMGTRQKLKDGYEFDLVTSMRKYGMSRKQAQITKRRLAKRRRKDAKIDLRQQHTGPGVLSPEGP